MDNQALNILVVEDNEGDLFLVKEYLEESLPDAQIFHAATLKTAFEELDNNNIDVVLLDITLPDSHGISTFQQVNIKAGLLPIIVLTGMGDTELALETVKYGAQDYIVKDDSNPTLLAKSIKYSIERKKIYDHLKKSEEQYKYLFHNNPLPMWAYETETFRFLMVNEAAVNHYGYSEEEFLNMTILDIRPAEDIIKSAKEPKKKQKLNQSESFRHLKKNGDFIDVETVTHTIFIDGFEAILVVVNDVTTRNKARKQLRESERTLRTISENFPNGAVAILDKDLKYQYTAGKEFHIPNVNPSYFNQTPFTQHFPPAVQEQVHENLMKVFKGESVVFEVSYDDSSYMISAVPLLDNERSVDKVILASQNISQQKEALKRVHLQSNILERLSNFVIVADNNFNITYYNKSAEDLFGDRLRLLTFKKLTPLFLPGYKQIADKAMKDALKNKTIDAELKCMNAHDEEIWINARFSKMLDEENNVIGTLCLGKDISVEKREEEQLRLFESVITNTNDAILITEAEPVDDSGGKIVYVNAAFTNMTGFTMDEVIGKTPKLFRGPQTDTRELAKLQDAVKNWQSCEVELLNYKKDGTRFWTNFTIVPVADKTGNFTHWISVQRDVTMRKRNEAEKELLIEELTQNNSDLRQFTYITSHNLRAPLSNLLGIIKLIDTSSITDPMNTLLIEKFKESTIQLNDTVNDLINVLIIKNKVNAKRETLDIRESFKRVKRSIQNTIDEFDVQIKTNFKEVHEIEFNNSYMESILLNLLTNAIKYRSPDQSPIINIYTKKEDDFIKLYFTDNGLGIDLDRYGDRLFGLYQRFHDHADSKGLGLYIVNSQVRAMGGNIEVISEVNKGTTFIITFKKSNSDD
jgi:PAS domain S-box-containing protein